ncbi:MAG: hypothetical protein ACR2QM_18245, partial [Longimicrobiales bacterium]
MPGEATIAPNGKRLSRKRVVWSAASLVLLVLVSFMFRSEPVTVDVAEAIHGVMDVRIEEDGRTQVKDRFQISAPITGTLLRLSLDPGDDVE